MVQHNNMKHTPEFNNGVPNVQDEITNEIKIEIGKLCADTLAKIKILQKSNDPEKHVEIIGLRKHLKEHVTPKVVNELLDKSIPALSKTKDADAPRKMAQRGIEYGILEGIYDIDTGQVKIETLNTVDGLQADTHEKVNFLLEEIRIKEMNQAVRGLNHSAQSWAPFHDLLNQAIENKWIFKNPKGQLKSTITYFDPKVETHPPEFLQSNDLQRSKMFKAAYRLAIGTTKEPDPENQVGLIDSFIMKKANLEQAAIKAAVKRQERKRTSKEISIQPNA